MVTKADTRVLLVVLVALKSMIFNLLEFMSKLVGLVYKRNAELQEKQIVGSTKTEDENHPFCSLLGSSNFFVFLCDIYPRCD